MGQKFDLKDIIAIGRTLDEYSRMFDLRFSGLKGAQVLDAGGGVSSFTAEANDMGLSVKSADRVYKFSAVELEVKCKNDLEEMFSKLLPVRNNYNWDFYGNEAGLRRYREDAYKKFLEDYGKNPHDRYIRTGFPCTAFTDREFDLTLMSHFLFLYDEHMDYSFHADTIAELIRITKEEIRIFPVVNLRYGRSGFLDRITNDSRFSKADFRVIKVDYEFVRGGNEYLSIRL